MTRKLVIQFFHIFPKYRDTWEPNVWKIIALLCCIESSVTVVAHVACQNRWFHMCVRIKLQKGDFFVKEITTVSINLVAKYPIMPNEILARETQKAVPFSNFFILLYSTFNVSIHWAYQVILNDYPQWEPGAATTPTLPPIDCFTVLVG